MSQRSLIEINHDFMPGPSDAELLDWAKRMRSYIGSGSREDLPKGATVFWRRHHADPCPFENPLEFERRYGRLARNLAKHQ
jgi:hypothetical protein